MDTQSVALFHHTRVAANIRAISRSAKINENIMRIRVDELFPAQLKVIRSKLG